MLNVIVLSLLAALVVTILAGAGVIRWLMRSFDRKEIAWTAERRELCSRLMQLSNSPWDTPPYVRDDERLEDDERLDPYRGIVMQPENMVDLPGGGAPDNGHVDVPVEELT